MDNVLEKKFDTWWDAARFIRSRRCALCLGNLTVTQENAIMCDRCGPSCDGNIITATQAQIVANERRCAQMEIGAAMRGKRDPEEVLSELGFGPKGER